MEPAVALDFARQHRNGVLVTIKQDGRPQLSNVTYLVDDDGTVRVSITADRAKYANLLRDPRVSLHISRDDFWGYVVLEGTAKLSPVAAHEDDATAEELVDLYRRLAGEHPDWSEYRAAMVRDRRVVVRFLPRHSYGMIGG